MVLVLVLVIIARLPRDIAAMTGARALRALMGGQAAPKTGYGSRRRDDLREFVPLCNSAGGKRVLIVRLVEPWHQKSL